MGHFAIVSPDDAGHLLAMGSLGKELVRRGHRVTVVGRERAAPLAEQLGLPLHTVDWDDTPWPWDLPMTLAFGLFGAAASINVQSWLRWQAEGILRAVPPALKELAVDGVLVDHVASAGGTAAERAGVPFVSVCTAMWWNEEPSVPPACTSWPYAEGRRAQWRNRLGYAGLRWFMWPTLNVINRYRRRWQLPRFSRIDDALSPLAQIVQLCAEFDFPRRPRSDVFHYVGSLAAGREVKTTGDFPWDRLNGRPLIFASLGTISYRVNRPMFRKILAACAGLEAQVVLALGNWEDEEDSLRDELGPIPDNAIVVDFAPQLALLDKAALLITHAGVNTVLEALCRGVPMVALPRNVDQPGMGARVEYAGVGLRTSFRHCTAEELRKLIRRVLDDNAFRQRARHVQQAMLAAGGAQRAADIAEQALSTRRPVLNR